MKNKQKGFMIPLVAVIAVLLIGSGAYVYSKNSQPKQTNQKVVSTTTNNGAIVETSANKDTNKNIQNSTTAIPIKTDATVKVVAPSPATITTSNNIDSRFDAFFKKWIAAWNKRDTNVLVNTFGYEDFQVQNMQNKDVWHYNSYLLYKSKSTPPSANDIADYKEYGGEVPFDVKVTGYYIVSKSAGVYSVAIINGNYKKNSEVAAITSWQIYPSEYEPKTYASIEDAKIQIDKLADK